MRLIKIVSLGLFILFLHSSILGIPFADMQTCELPNGDKIKIRTSGNWYLLKGLNPHGSAWGDRKRKVWYVPNEWFKFNLYLGNEGGCDDYSIFGDLINLAGKGLFLTPPTIL